MEKEIYISKEGLIKLKNELEQIKGVKMKEISQRIAQAKDMGDLSENAEYHEARQDQAFLAGRVRELEYKIKYAKVIEKSNNKNVVAVGSTVTVESESEKFDFNIVGSDETDPAQGMISASSPIGSTLLGKKVKDKVIVKTPSGNISYRIAKIS